MYLGIPVGSDEYKKRQLRILLDDFIQLCACDQSVSSPQERWVYLYWGDQTEVSFLAETHVAVHHHRHRQ
jgi:hypothetical protein